MSDDLIIRIPRPSDENLAVLRTIAMSPVTSVAVIDVKHPEGFAILQAYGLVESNEHAVWCSPFGRLVLEAAIQPNTDALKDAVEMCWGFFDQCCQDQRNMVPNREAMRDMCRHALDAAKAEAGEEG